VCLIGTKPCRKVDPQGQSCQFKKEKKNCASNIKPFRYRLEKQPSKIEFFTNIYSETN